MHCHSMWSLCCLCFLFFSVCYYPLLLPQLGPYVLQRVCRHYHPGTPSSFKGCTIDTVHHSMTDTKWYVQACHSTCPPPSQDLKHSPASPSAHHPPWVTLTWSSGYFGGCVCCPCPSTFHCGCSLCNPSYKDTPLVRLFSPSHFCFQFFHHRQTFSLHTTLHGAGLTPVGYSVGLYVMW